MFSFALCSANSDVWFMHWVCWPQKYGCNVVVLSHREHYIQSLSVLWVYLLLWGKCLYAIRACHSPILAHWQYIHWSVQIAIAQRSCSRDTLRLCDIYWRQSSFLTGNMRHIWQSKGFLILLIYKGSHREIYQEFQPSYDIIRRWCQGLIRPQVLCTPNLHCPIANTSSIQSQ